MSLRRAVVILLGSVLAINGIVHATVPAAGATAQVVHR